MIHMYEPAQTKIPPCIDTVYINADILCILTRIDTVYINTYCKRRRNNFW